MRLLLKIRQKCADIRWWKMALIGGLLIAGLIFYRFWYVQPEILPIPAEVGAKQPADGKKMIKVQSLLAKTSSSRN